jgi:VanZ family protein
MFVPNRRAQVTDWLADTAGAAIAVLVVMALARARRSRDDQSRSV